MSISHCPFFERFISEKQRDFYENLFNDNTYHEINLCPFVELNLNLKIIVVAEKEYFIVQSICYRENYSKKKQLFSFLDDVPFTDTNLRLLQRGIKSKFGNIFNIKINHYKVNQTLPFSEDIQSCLDN